jgi:hypothetical protein
MAWALVALVALVAAKEKRCLVYNRNSFYCQISGPAPLH